MKFHKSLFIVLLQTASFTVTIINSAVYLRAQSPTSPIAINSGIQCIHSLSDIYFHQERSTQVPNIAFMHEDSLSTPAREIEEGTLIMLHKRMVEDEVPVKFQLRVYNSKPSLRNFQSMQTIVISLNFYVIVIDNFQMVRVS